MTLTIPIRTYSEANLREHWAKKARRVKAQREAVAWIWRTRPQMWVFPLTCTLTRLAPRALDSDNLARSFKACRDEIANQLGVDDRDKRMEWKYDQRKGKPKEYAVEITIAPQP